MQRISLIAKCFVWLAALLAPAQAIFALHCRCEHCRHQEFATLAHVCDATCAAHHSAAPHCNHDEPEGSDCCCKRSTQPQQPGSPSFEFRVDIAAEWGVVDAWIGAHVSPVKTARVAPLAPNERPLDQCARLCRFLV